MSLWTQHPVQLMTAVFCISEAGSSVAHSLMKQRQITEAFLQMLKVVVREYEL
jgi:hypothetical protein